MFMGFLSKFFKQHEKGELSSQAPLADYIQILDPSKSSVLFQVAEQDALKVLAAFSERKIIRFRGTSGRHCVINLNHVPAIRHFKAPMNSTGLLEIEGVLVQLVNAEPVDIPVDQHQVETLFTEMTNGKGIAEIGEWRLRTSNIIAIVVSDKYNPSLYFANRGDHEKSQT